MHISWSPIGKRSQHHKPLDFRKFGLILYLFFRNPTIEEQALARVYRLGQEKKVTTVRFYVNDTFEEVRYLPLVVPST